MTAATAKKQKMAIIAPEFIAAPKAITAKKIAKNTMPIREPTSPHLNKRQAFRQKEGFNSWKVTPCNPSS